MCVCARAQAHAQAQIFTYIMYIQKYMQTTDQQLLPQDKNLGTRAEMRGRFFAINHFIPLELGTM